MIFMFTVQSVRVGGKNPFQANAIKRKLNNVKEGDIHLYINSFGGSVFDGISIYNQLKRHSSKVIVHVDGIAASSIINCNGR
ncbi:ATP-dependent Clp protease proteolytic subunit [Bacillus cereus]